jgi:pantoate--beta-alanine ligase
MKIVENPSEIYSLVASSKCNGKRVGLVPTMGALHAGHLSLVEEAKRHCDIAIATIFVNPTQFGPNEDFSKYPRTLDSDLEQLERAKCDWVFVPSTMQMFPEGLSTYLEPPTVSKNWEGQIRPGHFRGVTTVVLKLFHMIPADVAFFGRKDYQQVAVLRAMVRDLNVPIELIACHTVREQDGLAMSSRNRYLSPTDRGRAVGLWNALQHVQSLVREGCHDVERLESEMRDVLLAVPVDRIDYAAIVDGVTMEPLSHVLPDAVAIIAVRIGTTRLIDNLSLDV